MYKKIQFLLIFTILGYAFTLSQPFKVVAAGVAVFLFGMLFMEKGFQAFVGGILDKILKRFTNTVSKSILFGLVSTAVMQSSSLVTVIAISILSAGLITLKAGIGIIYGSNLGTTTGAWLMAAFGLKIDLAAYAMPMIIFGIILILQKNKSYRGVGNILAGVGFVFLGVAYMKEGFEAFSASLDLTQFAMSGFGGLVVYTLVGIAVTVIMQSSHATLMLTIAALAAGQLTYENALALSIGSNVGTTITGLLGSMNANVAGKRLAVAHMVFNVVTGLTAIILIKPFMWGVDAFADLTGIAEDNWTLKLATFHTIFNVAGVAMMVPVMEPLLRFLKRTVTDKQVLQEQGVVLEPLYLNESALKFPDTAMEVLVKETEHLLQTVVEVVVHGLNLHRTDIRSDRDLAQVVMQSTEIMKIDILKKYYTGVKSLYNAIIEFSVKVPASSDLNAEQVAALQNIRLACRSSAEAVKLTSHLRENVNRYMNSENKYIRQQYNLIRHSLARTLRQLFNLRESGNGDDSAKTISLLRKRLARVDVLADGTLDQLVRDDAIDSSMATSLMNDTVFAYEIGIKMIEITEDLLSAEGLVLVEDTAEAMPES